MEELQKSTPDALSEKINNTHNTALRSLAELLEIITKVAEKQSTNRNNGWRREVVSEPDQGRAPIKNSYPTRQHQN